MLGVLFQTKTLIPIEAFTAFGVNSKPNSTNPFGYFGTGLKYAIAVLVRTKHKVTLWIGTTQYEFYVQDKDFRGKEFGFVRMKRTKHTLGQLASQYFAGKPAYIQLPFTTELGKNWEVWQAFRELESNTRDEDGFSTVVSANSIFGDSDTTKIFVEGEGIVQAHRDRDSVFLPDDMLANFDPDISTSDIQVFKKASRHIYYRGIRVYDLDKDKPGLYTYNFLKRVDLTEDRTAKSPWSLQDDIAQLTNASKSKEFVTDIVTSPSNSFESSIGFGYMYSAPSPAFIAAVKEAPKEKVRTSAMDHVKLRNPDPAPSKPKSSFPRNWVLYADNLEVYVGTDLMFTFGIPDAIPLTLRKKIVRALQMYKAEDDPLPIPDDLEPDEERSAIVLE